MSLKILYEGLKPMKSDDELNCNMSRVELLMCAYSCFEIEISQLKKLIHTIIT